MYNGKASMRLGIVFTGGEGPPPKALTDVLNNFAAREHKSTDQIPPKPLIVAADSGLLLAEKAGFIPDWIIGDMDSVDTERLAAYAPEKILRFPRDKDYTDTELAFSLLREKGCGPVWIIGGGGGRIDHLFGIRSLFERDYPPERWLTATEDLRCLQAPQKTIEKSSRRARKERGGEIKRKINSSSSANSAPLREPQPSPEGEGSPLEDLCEKCLSSKFQELPSVLECTSYSPFAPVSVFPLGDGPWEAESAGLKWPLNGISWNRGFFGLSNEAPEGAFTIRAKQGRFLVMINY